MSLNVFPDAASLLTHSFLVLSFFISSSENGSPVDAVDESALVATITKKRHRNSSSDSDTAANFEINVGGGKYVSLTDPVGIGNLDSEGRLQAFNHLQVLQDQVAKIMKGLTTKDE
jgi:hypothetical protein